VSGDVKNSVLLFLCGDVMTGRGIDQILPCPSDPVLYEQHVQDARYYVTLAEQANGPIPRTAPLDYIWGIALEEFARHSPDLKVINLETAVTVSNDAWPGKGIHYRMHPRNVGCLTAAGVDCCSLANNHVLDWGDGGLEETLRTLDDAGIRHGGAGRTLAEARRPVIFKFGGDRRVIIVSLASPSSGVPSKWAAGEDNPGVDLVSEWDRDALEMVTQLINGVRQPGDVVLVTIHWGGNWGYEVPPEQQHFARKLIEEANVDVVFGHSSHHVKGIEVYRGRLIVYGTGDLLTDYEGIGGYERYRGDLGLLYFPSIDPETGVLLHLRMVPTQMKRFQLTRPSGADVCWLADVLNREGRRFGTSVALDPEGHLTLNWRPADSSLRRD
jgi:poly-gamma-glutamate capsule biosynthesis protein CapA/YwtB (metallophosphatase superfamily)